MAFEKERDQKNQKIAEQVEQAKSKVENIKKNLERNLPNLQAVKRQSNARSNAARKS